RVLRGVAGARRGADVPGVGGAVTGPDAAMSSSVSLVARGRATGLRFAAGGVVGISSVGMAASAGGGADLGGWVSGVALELSASGVSTRISTRGKANATRTMKRALGKIVRASTHASWRLLDSCARDWLDCQRLCSLRALPPPGNGGAGAQHTGHRHYGCRVSSALGRQPPVRQVEPDRTDDHTLSPIAEGVWDHFHNQVVRRIHVRIDPPPRCGHEQPTLHSLPYMISLMGERLVIWEAALAGVG